MLQVGISRQIDRVVGRPLLSQSLSVRFLLGKIFPFSLSEIHTLNLKKKAKVKASAWKTIRKTRYNIYEDYFQVFRGFSKKSYPENLKNKKLIKNGSEIEYHRKCVRVGYGGKLQNIWVKSIFWTHTNLLTLQSVDEKIVMRTWRRWKKWRQASEYDMESDAE